MLLQRHSLPAGTGNTVSGSSERSDQLRYPHPGTEDIRSHLLSGNCGRMSVRHLLSRGGSIAHLCTRIPTEAGSSQCSAVDGRRRGGGSDPLNVPGIAEPRFKFAVDHTGLPENSSGSTLPCSREKKQYRQRYLRLVKIVNRADRPKFLLLLSFVGYCSRVANHPSALELRLPRTNRDDHLTGTAETVVAGGALFPWGNGMGSDGNCKTRRIFRVLSLTDSSGNGFMLPRQNTDVPGITSRRRNNIRRNSILPSISPCSQRTVPLSSSSPGNDHTL